MIVILVFLFNYFNDCDACIVFHQLRENNLSHLTCEEANSIIQSIGRVVYFYLSLLTTNHESDVLISPFYQGSVSNDCHSTYHLHIITSNDICFTSFDLHGLTSHPLSTCQTVDALHCLLMVMSAPCCLDKPVEYDKINCHSQDSHLDIMLLISNSSFHRFQNVQEDCFEFHDPVYVCPKSSFLAIPLAKRKFQYFLMLAKKDETNEGAFTGISHGFSAYNGH